MKFSLSVISIVLCSIFINTGLARIETATEKRETDRKDLSLLEKFRNMCNMYEKPGNRQFAVLWVGEGPFKETPKKATNQQTTDQQKSDQQETDPRITEVIDIKKSLVHNQQTHVRLAGERFAFAVYPSKENEPLTWLRASYDNDGEPPNKQMKTNTGAAVATATVPPTITLDGVAPSKDDPKLGFAVHTEVLVLNKALKILEKSYKGMKPKLYLYTRNSPCCTPYSEERDGPGSVKGECKIDEKEKIKSCSRSVRNWVEENTDKIHSLTIAWDLPYNPAGVCGRPNLNYLYGLNTMLKTKNSQIKIHHTEYDTQKKVKYCAPTASKKWLQKHVFDCMKSEVDGSKCTSTGEKNEHLAKLVNRVSWKCGTNKLEIYHKYFLYASVEPKCWSDEIENMVSDKNKKLADLSCLKEKEMNKDKLLLGPPLDPSNPETNSNDPKELTGDDTQLCI